jgi:hypothetical protein
MNSAWVLNSVAPGAQMSMLPTRHVRTSEKTSARLKMPPPPGRESASCLKTVVLHALILGSVGFFWYLILGLEGFGLVLLAYVAVLSGLAFRRVFRPVEKKE